MKQTLLRGRIKMKKQSIIADIKEKGEYIRHPWSSCISVGQACEGLRTNWVKQLTVAVKECGFRYIHLNGLLSDNMFVYYEEEGISYYNWQYIDSLFDSILESGIRPFVELGYMPYDLASGNQTIYWWKGNITPPKDYQRWANLIYALLKHWVERYGMHELLKWYFEVWSEANHPNLWGGTKEDYFELFRVTVETLKGIHQRLRIGGPSIQLGTQSINFNENAIWLSEFLAFCALHQLQLDFISIHTYGAIHEEIDQFREVIANSEYKSVKLHITEFCSSDSHRDYSHDGLPMAAYLVHQNLSVMKQVHSLSYRGLSDMSEDVKGPPKSFHGGMGLINMQGIKKPSFHAYRMLNLLGTSLIKKEEGYVITKTAEGKVRALFYNYPEELKVNLPSSIYPYQEVAKEIEQLGEKRKLDMTLHNLNPESNLIVEIMDMKHGDVIRRWRAMGSPAVLALYEVKELKDLAERTLKLFFTVDEDGTATIQFTLPPFAIASLVER